MDTVQQPVSLRDRQLALEEESLTLGIDRYKKERSRQEEADSGPGRRLILDTITPLAAAIDAFVAEARNGKAGKRHTAVRWVEKFPSAEIAYITVRHCLNALSSQDTRVQTVAEAIATSLEDSINYSRFREVSPGLYKHIQQVLKKSTSKRHSRNVMEAATRRVELDQFAFPGHDGDVQGEIAAMLRTSKHPNVRLACPDGEHERDSQRCKQCGGCGTVESAEEWSIHDYDHFPNMGENPALSDVIEMAERIEEHGDAWLAYVEHVGSRYATESGFNDHQAGSADTELEWVENFVDDMGILSEMPENLRKYFDHEAYLRDLKYGGEIGFTEYEGTTYAFWNH